MILLKAKKETWDYSGLFYNFYPISSCSDIVSYVQIYEYAPDGCPFFLSSQPGKKSGMDNE
jgi:hypothetical protein